MIWLWNVRIYTATNDYKPYLLFGPSMWLAGKIALLWFHIRNPKTNIHAYSTQGVGAN